MAQRVKALAAKPHDPERTWWKNRLSQVAL